MTVALEAPTPTGDSAGKLSSEYLTSTESCGFHLVGWLFTDADAGKKTIRDALRQPPQPTGDVGELEAEIAKILNDQYEAMTVTLRDGTRQYFAARAAKAVMEPVNSRSPRQSEEPQLIWNAGYRGGLEAAAEVCDKIAADQKERQTRTMDRDSMFACSARQEGAGLCAYDIRAALTGAGEEGE